MKTTRTRTKLCSMNAKISFISSILLAGFVVGCGSQPIIPEGKNVTLSREDAKKNCEEIGPVQGKTATVKGTIEEAIEDMKLDAARKGANYVRMQSTSAYGTSTSGTAYRCP